MGGVRRLTRDAGANLLSGAQSLTTLDNINWTLNNLSSVTSLSGLYQLLLTSAVGPVIDVAGNTSGDVVETFTVTASVLGRLLFYNRSSFDGNNAALNASDDLAVAPDKSAYLPGSGAASFESVSSYSRGINGLMVDISGSHPGITAADFTFRIGSNNDPGSWSAAPPPLAVSVRAGAGTGGSDRVEIVWAEGAIKNTWLEVSLLATSQTGLDEADVFYWGSRIGDSGTSSIAGVFTTNATDSLQVFATAGAGKPKTDLRDYNRDGIVNSTDSLIVFANAGTLPKINLSPPPALVAMALVSASPLVGESTLASVATEGSDQPVEAAAPLVTPLIAPVSPLSSTRDQAFAFAFEAWRRELDDEADGADEEFVQALASAKR